ncbi:hypothetical protein [Rhizobium sp. SYY.PMSO]|uniref:hypothetical protein n=1 Tax=Rhizobium sp. SYY.PMSO TaxID=3382192 RepID=UPI0013AFF3C5
MMIAVSGRRVPWASRPSADRVLFAALTETACGLRPCGCRPLSRDEAGWTPDTGRAPGARGSSSDVLSYVSPRGLKDGAEPQREQQRLRARPARHLVAKLDRATEALHEEIETEKRLAAGKGTEDGDFLYEIYHTCTTFENRWVESGPISILDEIYEDVVFEGESCRIGLEYTIVPDAELEGLAEILDSIRRETGIEFVAARV